MTRLIVEPEAEEELDEAATRYEAAVPGLGQQFLAEMRLRVGNVLQTPLAFPVFGDADDVRCAHAVGRFPHLVVFKLVGDTVSPTVGAVTSASRFRIRPLSRRGHGYTDTHLVGHMRRHLRSTDSVLTSGLSP
jgi:hypothetical protein